MTDDYIKREDAINKLAKIITGDIFKEIKEDTKKSVAKDFFPIYRPLMLSRL